MAIVKDIWVGDIGTIFRGTIIDSGSAIDIQSATVKKIVFVKPDGTEMEKDAAFTTDGTDGQIEYQTVSGDLSAPGVWSYYAKITYSGGYRRTSYSEFTVWE